MSLHDLTKKFRAKNYMAYDLGFDNEDTSQEYAR